MLERKKQYTEPAGKKKWSDGSQAVPSCLHRQIRPVDPPGYLYGPAQDKDLSASFTGRKGHFCISEGRGSGLSKDLGHDLPAVRALLQGVEVHINGTYRRKVPEPVQGVQIPALIFVSANKGWGLSMLLQGAVLFPGPLYNESKSEITGDDSHAGKALHNALRQDSLLGES